MAEEQTRTIFRLEFSIATMLFGCFMFSMGWFLCDLAPSVRMIIENLVWNCNHTPVC